MASKTRGKGEGSIFYSKKLKKWLGQFNNGYKDNGKLNRKTVYGNTRAEVKEKMLKYQHEVQHDIFCDKDNSTFFELANSILETKHSSNRIQDTSLRRNLGTLKKFQCLYNIELQKITPKDLQIALNNNKHLSNSYLDKMHSLLNLVFGEAVRRKIINTNPMEFVLKPKSTQIEDDGEAAFSIEEQQSILGALTGEKYEIIFMIAFHTGMRIGEILALTEKDIDFEKKQIRINKTLTRDLQGKPKVNDTTKTPTGVRTIPFISLLEPHLKSAVNNYQKNTHHLLFQENDKPIATSTINSQFKRICKNLDIRVVPKLIIRPNKEINSKTSDVHVHMMRHTYATRCIESGMPPVVLQRLLGHKDVSVTLNTYTSVFNRFQANSLDSYITYMETLETETKKENKKIVRIA